MEKHIREFINGYIGVSEVSCGDASVNDIGEIEVEGADIQQRLTYFCRKCNAEIEPNDDALIEHVTTHMEDREYFIYAKHTIRIFGKSEKDAIKNVVDSQRVIKYLDVKIFDLEGERTEEDFFCDHCLKWHPAPMRCNTGDEFDYCKECFESVMKKCFMCNQNFLLKDLTYVEGDNYTCDGCLPPETCADCGEELDSDNISVGKEKYCVDCSSYRMSEEEAKKDTERKMPKRVFGKDHEFVNHK